ncbi:uncharacterized protein [Blastocystis hominis]|uniref:Nuclear speckle splicing regulatory protein 1 N-terminal domain-containing protein n=1 Tax=Blastocystis hominis TaxID=12968 RepID=D8MBS8_BLAHO|nr:uncharacterized protein [Blastocystis hominis]CBK25517.2 unnamed protein product [Blastocystis hominis]|eukprot:XP_012899565.1 uncharacterized protein [Blastocystis hominis]
MNSGKLIQSKVQETSAELKSLFNGETESAADRIRRLQIMSDINYGIDKNFTEKETAEEPLGDLYDYDSYLEEKEKKEEQEEKKTKVKKQSKYIAILKQRAEERKREMDIIYEKNRIKEREKEDALYAGKEKFITSAYKRKLEADRKWMEEVRKKELAKGNKGRFLANMMNSRADETEETVETVETMGTGEAKGKVESKNEDKAKAALGNAKKEEEVDNDDEFDGFILRGR